MAGAVGMPAVARCAARSFWYADDHERPRTYIHDSEHPHLCTDINVDAELAKGEH